MNNEEPMNKEPNKPIPAQELTEKELEGISGGINTPFIGPLGLSSLTDNN